MNETITVTLTEQEVFTLQTALTALRGDQADRGLAAAICGDSIKVESARLLMSHAQNIQSKVSKASEAALQRRIAAWSY